MLLKSRLVLGCALGLLGCDGGGPDEDGEHDAGRAAIDANAIRADASPGVDAGEGGDDGGIGGDDAGAPDSGVDDVWRSLCHLEWESGFERGFPGEWTSFDNGSYSADGRMPAGRVSAWTIVDRASGEPVHSGDHSYKGWITGASTDNHRAYPVVHLDAIPAAAIVNTFYVYLDVDYSAMGADEWIALGTWGNANPVWALHTMSMRDQRVEFAHTSPFSGEPIGAQPRPFPLRRWIRFTVYVHYEGTTGFVQAWMDGVPVLRGHVSQLGRSPGHQVTRAHWGMYAPPHTTQGVQYNDSIGIWSLARPLDPGASSPEPACYRL